MAKETVSPASEIIEVIKESGGDSFKLCYQCGLCDTVCPWNRVKTFSMRKLVRQAVFGLRSPYGSPQETRLSYSRAFEAPIQ